MKAARVWALLLVAVGSQVQAQGQPYYPAPQMAFHPGQHYGRPVSPTLPPRGYLPPAPRVMYVPASPTPWLTADLSMAAPASLPAAAVPAPSPAAAPVPASGDALRNYAAKTETAAEKVPAQTVALRKHKNEVIVGSTCAPAATECPPDACPPPVPAYEPHAPHHHGHHHGWDPHANWLPRGWNLQVMSGHYFDVDASNYNWVPVSLRMGRVWDCECWRHAGAFEGILDLTGGVVVNSDYGDWFIGPSAILRYNFVQLGSRFVPYVQGGVGFQYNDAYQDDTPVAGSRIELTAQAQMGFRLFLTKHWSVDFEGGFQHISNLNMSDRDEGINALGATVGFSHFSGQK